MNKLFVFMATLFVLPCTVSVHAQNAFERVVTIEEMFSLADRNAKSLRPFVTMLEEAAQNVKTAKSARLPDVDASISVSLLGDGVLLDRDFSNSTKAPIPRFGNNFVLEVSQVIYAGGGVSGGIEIGKLQERMASLSLESERDKLRFMLVGYYLDLFKQRNLLRVYDQNIEQTRQVLVDIKARYAEGVALGNDVTRYELQLSNLELDRTRIRNTVAILNHDLVTILG